MERDLQRLDAALEGLSHGGDRTESRRPLAAIFDALSRDAAELRRTERDLSPERRRGLEKFERDTAQAARDENDFWKAAGTSRATLPSAEVAALRSTKERLAKDLDEESMGRSGAAPRRAPTTAQTAALAAREKAAQTQEQAAGARVKRALQNPWEEKTGVAAGPATSKPPASTPTAASTGACPQCNARNRPAGLHTDAVPDLAAKPPESRGLWGSLYDDVAGPVSSAYAKALFVKRKVEEATGPVASGVLEGVAETAAGITIGALLWALGKLVGKIVLGGLLSELGVGEAILAAALKTILIGLGVVLTGMQILAMARAFSRWRSAEPGTAESANALRDFVRSATVAVLAIALAVIGINSGKPKVPRPNQPTPPPIADTPPPAPTEGVGGNLSKIKPPEPPPEPEPTSSGSEGKATGGRGSYRLDESHPSGPPDPTAEPTGRPKRARGTDQANINATNGENDAAKVLARKGFRVEQLTEVKGRSANPDYKIDGRIFDCYTPQEGTSVRNILSNITDKVPRQAERIVLNMNYVNNPDTVLAELSRQLNTHAIPDLKEIIVVRGGSYWHIQPTQ